MRVAASRRVIPRQLVHKTNVRATREDGFHIYRIVQCGNHFELPNQSVDLFRSALLNRAHYNILPALFAPPPLIEHAKGLTYSRSISEKDLEPAARVMRLLLLNLAQQRVGIRP